MAENDKVSIIKTPQKDLPVLWYRVRFRGERQIMIRADLICAHETGNCLFYLGGSLRGIVSDFQSIHLIDSPSGQEVHDGILT